MAIIALIAFSLPAHGDQSVTLAWDPNPEPDVSGYIVYFGNASRDYPSSTNVGNVTTATVYGLQEGLTYYFAITATNTAGLESDYSNEVTNSIPSDLTNSVPTISPLVDQTIQENTTTSSLAFTVNDAETPAANLTVSASSTNTTLVPNTSILLGGSSNNRTAVIRPATNLFGKTLITLTVSDGSKASSTSFLVTVDPSPLAIDQWRHTQFSAQDLADPAKAATVWGDKADPDNDGRENLVEYALGLDPMASEPSQEALVSSVSAEGSTNRLCLTFVRRKNDASLQYLPEVSADHVHWNGQAAVRELNVTPLSAEFEGVTYQDLTPVPTNQPRFIRLRIIKN